MGRWSGCGRVVWGGVVGQILVGCFFREDLMMGGYCKSNKGVGVKG